MFIMVVVSMAPFNKNDLKGSQSLIFGKFDEGIQMKPF